MSSPLMKYKPPPDEILTNKRTINNIRQNYLIYLRTMIHTRKTNPNKLKTSFKLTYDKQTLINKRMQYLNINTCTSSQCIPASPPSGAPPVGHNWGRVVLSHNKNFDCRPFWVSLKGPPSELRAVALISSVLLSQDKDFLVEALGSPLRGLSAVALTPSPSPEGDLDNIVSQNFAPYCVFP